MTTLLSRAPAVWPKFHLLAHREATLPSTPLVSWGVTAPFLSVQQLWPCRSCSWWIRLCCGPLWIHIASSCCLQSISKVGSLSTLTQATVISSRMSLAIYCGAQLYPAPWTCWDPFLKRISEARGFFQLQFFQQILRLVKLRRSQQPGPILHGLPLLLFLPFLSNTKYIERLSNSTYSFSNCRFWDEMGTVEALDICLASWVRITGGCSLLRPFYVPRPDPGAFQSSTLKYS